MRIARCLAFLLVLVVAVGCSSDSPTGPSGSNGSGSGGDSGGGSSGGGGGDTGPPLSSTTATIDGQPYTATEILAPSPDFIEDTTDGAPRLLNVATGENSTGLGLAFSAPAEVGTHRTPTIGVQASLTQLQPYGPGELPQPVSDAPQWIALPPLGGSGSVTITTLTETTATGTFSFMLVPAPPPSTATGNRTMSGSFSLTFTDSPNIQF